MPKPPITINIVPSRLALAVHATLVLAVSTLLLVFSTAWLALAALLLTGTLLLDWWRCQQRWALRHTAGGGVVKSWQIRDADSAQVWRPARLEMFYLGPWLIGLTLGSRWRRMWLWPDSASSAERRELRRRLLAERASEVQ